MLSANFWLIVLSLHTGPKVRTALPAARGTCVAVFSSISSRTRDGSGGRHVCEIECHAGIRTRQVAPKTGVNRDRFLSLFNLKPLYIVVLYFIFCVVVKNRQTD